MANELLPFLMHWAITSMALWVASHVFRGIHFADVASLLVAALLLGFANAVVRPLFIVLTLPLTLLSFGLFLLVINALMILLVSALVKGFHVSSFWTAFFASIFIAIISLLLEIFLLSGNTDPHMQMPTNGQWL